jgi:lipid II:glycine glycyltransferase (peptidoglycan interpeptide bridge formation enzyme)
MKQDVLIRNGMEYLKPAYELVRDTFKRSNLGFMDYEAFERYVLSLNENVKIFVAEYQGTVQGCVVVPFSTYRAYYVYGGSIPEPHTGATNLIHWEAIRFFRGLGVKSYDFVGVRIDPKKESKQEGLMMYKARFGGRLVQGYMWKYSINPVKYAVYSLAVRILRSGDIVDQERHKLESV